MNQLSDNARFNKENRHVPVMLDEVLDGLRLQSGMTVVDATIGNAGHSIEIASIIGKNGLLIGLDADPLAIEESEKFIESTEVQFKLFNTNFSNLESVLVENNLAPVDSVLMDLGLRRGSLEDSGRGFSFQQLSEPLDMRFNPNDPELLTAAEIVNSWSQEVLADVMYGFGGERLSRRYAKAIIEAREESPIKTVGQLVEIINRVTPGSARRPGRSSATKVFQALRIAVNRELQVLEDAVRQAIKVIKTNGRLAVITFHSGEDRMVKRLFKKLASQNIITINPKKPLKPNRQEVKNNPLSRSATLRLVTIN